MADFELSTYQKDILDFFTNHPSENMYINALAGSGKSSTACMLTEHSTTSDIYVAFNKSIAEEFKTKIANPKTKVSTMHSLFYYIMNNNLEEQKKKKAVLNGLKPYKILDEKIQRNYKYEKFEYKIFLKNNYINLYNLCRLTCTGVKDENGIRQLIRDHNLFNDTSKKHFKIPTTETIIDTLVFLDRRSKEIFEETSEIDFTDMLYITHNKLCEGEWKVPFTKKYTNIYVDECLSGDSIVVTNKGNCELKSLYNKHIKKSPLPLAKSFNEKNNCFEFKQILNVKKHENRQTYRIKTEGLNQIVATENHKFLTQRGYVRVDELQIGKDVLFLDKPENQKAKYILNEDQLQVVLASSIGDGHLTKQSKYNTYRLGFTQGDKQYNYFEFKKNLLNCTHERKIKSGYTGLNNINQCCTKNFLLFEDKWELMRKIDEKFLAIWYQDDGNGYSYTDKEGNTYMASVKISCNNLNEIQVDYLCNIIKNKFNIIFKKVLHKNKYWDIFLDTNNSIKFCKLIAPYMNKDCAYKNIYFDGKKLYKWDNKFLPYGGNFVTDIQKEKVEDVFDIEVEDNHNFVCKKTHSTSTTGIICHNCQDLSTIQLFLLKFIKRKNGRYVYIGDFHQSVYGFAGSSCHSCESIKNLFAPITEFDLPICYRCAKSHLKMVNKLFDIPILPCPDAPEGTITTIDKSDVRKYIKPGDFIISRKNKWLANVIIDLAKNNIPVYLEDKDFVNNIVKQVDKIKADNLRELNTLIKQKVEDCEKELEKTVASKKITDAEKETVVTSTNSELDGLSFIWTILDGYRKINPDGTIMKFKVYMKRVLNVIPNKDSVRISSVHKAKGLEADTVFVLNEGKVCFDPRNSFDLNQQEKNLSYISLTRAKTNLYLVRESEK